MRQSRQGLESYSNMGCWHHRLWINPLCYATHPTFNKFIFYIHKCKCVYTHTYISFIYICKTFESHWRLIEQILQRSSSKDKEILLNNYNTMIVFGHLTLRPLSNLLLILNFSNYLNNMFYNCFFFQSTFNWESHDVFTYYVSSSLE